MVNIDTVYQKVLALANKEQRGYITPQEFNLFAKQAQMSIFEQYFYDLNQFERLPGNDTGHSDIINILREKISIFEFNAPPIYIEQNFPVTSVYGGGAIKIPDEVYRLGDIRLKCRHIKHGHGRLWTQVEMLTPKQFNSIVYTPKPLIKPTPERPIGYISRSGGALFPDRYLHIAYNMIPSETMYESMNVVWVGDDDPNLDITRLAMDYIIRPNKDVKWGYNVVGNNETALYDPTKSIDFDLHESEEVELVNKILALAGVTIKAPDLYQAAVVEDNKNTKQEKQ